ncbi:MAG: phosphohistidine phosphatase SixA [Acidiferrobacterales bacterium]
MKLFLVQHGDALPKDLDPERSLSEKGRTNAQQLAIFLHPRHLQIAHVWHSGKTRARETAEIIATKLVPTVAVDATTGIDPMDDPEPFAQKLQRSAENIMVVGHLPFLARLASRLVADDPEADVVSFIPGSIACIEHVDDKWAVAWMLRPELIPGSAT